MEKKVFIIFRSASVTQNGSVFIDQICHHKTLYQYSITQKTRFRLLTDYETTLSGNPIWEERFWRVSRFVLLSQKNGFIFLTKFGIINCWANILWLTRFDLGLWQIWKEIYRKLQYREKFVGKFQGLPDFWALYQYSIGQMIRFRLLEHFKTNL